MSLPGKHNCLSVCLHIIYIINWMHFNILTRYNISRSRLSFRHVRGHDVVKCQILLSCVNYVFGLIITTSWHRIRCILKRISIKIIFQFVHHGPLYSTYWDSSLSSKSTFSLFIVVHLSFRKNICCRIRTDCFLWNIFLICSQSM